MSFPSLIIDFDSTFVGVESLDVLAEIALTAHPERAARTAEVQHLTTLAMNGEIAFAEALTRRLELIAPRREHIAALVERLRANISPSFRRNREFLAAQAAKIWIVSAGFHEFIDPVIAKFGLRREQVLANRFRFGGDAITGFDAGNPLAADGGKVNAVAALGLAKPIVAIGDGISDYELFAAGVADRFFAYTESVRRDKLIALAPQTADDLDEILAAIEIIEKEPS
ncbi:MAG: HAD-IB family phosphatase [Gammaproteobacteria bacterium]